jgi:hypothetical protein
MSHSMFHYWTKPLGPSRASAVSSAPNSLIALLTRHWSDHLENLDSTQALVTELHDVDSTSRPAFPLHESPRQTQAYGLRASAPPDQTYSSFVNRRKSDIDHAAPAPRYPSHKSSGQSRMPRHDVTSDKDFRARVAAEGYWIWHSDARAGFPAGTIDARTISIRGETPRLQGSRLPSDSQYWYQLPEQRGA